MVSRKVGLYRNVHVINTDRVHVPTWGTYITTPYVSAEKASVHLEIEIKGANKGEKIDVETKILSPDGKVVAENNAPYIAHGQIHSQNFLFLNRIYGVSKPLPYTQLRHVFL